MTYSFYDKSIIYDTEYSDRKISMVDFTWFEEIIPEWDLCYKFIKFLFKQKRELGSLFLSSIVNFSGVLTSFKLTFSN